MFAAIASFFNKRCEEIDRIKKEKARKRKEAEEKLTMPQIYDGRIFIKDTNVFCNTFMYEAFIKERAHAYYLKIHEKLANCLNKSYALNKLYKISISDKITIYFLFSQRTGIMHKFQFQNETWMEPKYTWEADRRYLNADGEIAEYNGEVLKYETYIFTEKEFPLMTSNEYFMEILSEKDRISLMCFGEGIEEIK